MILKSDNIKYSELLILLDSLSNNISDAHFIINEDFKVIYANEKFISFFNLTKTDLIKIEICKSLPDFEGIINEFKNQNLGLMSSKISYKSKHSELQLDVELNISKIPNYPELINIVILSVKENILYYNSIVDKIKFQTIINNSPTLIWESDINGKINFCNKSFKEYLGLHQFLPEEFNKLNYIYPDDIDAYKQRFHLTMRNNQCFKGTYRLLSHNNEYRWISEQILPLYNSAEELIGYTGYIYDINDLKINEQIKATLYNISESLATVDNINDLFKNVHQAIKNLIYIDNFTVAINHPSSQLISFPNIYDSNEETFQTVSYGKSLIDFVFKTKSPLMVNKFHILELLEKNEISTFNENIEHWMGIPIVIKKEVFGCIVIQSYNPNLVFNLENKKSMEYIAEQVTTAIERIQDKDKLRFSELKFRNLFLSLNDSIAYNEILFDEDGNPINFIINEINPIYKKHFGINEKKVLFKPIIKDGEKPFYFDIFLRVIKNKKIETFELFYPLTQRYFFTTVYPISNSEFITSYKDITAEKNALTKLETQRFQIQQILDISEVIIGLIDIKGKILSINRKGIELLGYTKNELMGMNWLDVVNNREFTESYKILYEDFIKQGKRSIKKIEIDVYTKNKQKKTIYFHNVLLTEGEDKIFGLLFSGIDITDRKVFENDLLISKKKIEEASHLKSVILGNLSHELRTPLNGILGFSHLLKDSNLDDENKEMVELINKSGLRLMNTLNSILTLAEIEANNLYVNFERINLSKLLEYYAPTYKDMANDKGLEFELEVCDPEIYCNLDDYLLGQILFNLIDNSVKYTNVGVIKIELVKSVIDDETYATIKVCDTGVGISENQTKHIFEAFRQGSEGIDRSFEGVGLGLTIAQKMATKLHGTISLSSKVNVGTELSLTFLIIE